MNDMRRPGMPVPAGEAAEDFRRKCHALDAERRAEAWRRRGLLAVAGAGGLFGISGWAARELWPIVVREERLVPLGPGNVPLAAYDPARLPAEVLADTAVNAAWRFAVAWEGYSASRDVEDWEVVHGMATQDVAEAWRRDRHPEHPDSRWRRYGKDVEIVPLYDSHIDICDPGRDGCAGDITGYRFRFNRVVRKAMRPVEEILHDCTVRFRRNVPNLPQSIVAQHNAARVQVWRHEPAVAVGPRRSQYA